MSRTILRLRGAVIRSGEMFSLLLVPVQRRPDMMDEVGFGPTLDEAQRSSCKLMRDHFGLGDYTGYDHASRCQEKGNGP